jgi:hypothetical protein
VAYAKGYNVAGGVVGWSGEDRSSGGKITTCRYGDGVVSATVSAANYAGGVVGHNFKGTVEYCYATGAVSAADATVENYAGGIVGYNSGTLDACVALTTGGVSAGTPGDLYAGRVAGESAGSIIACFGAIDAIVSTPGGNNSNWDGVFDQGGTWGIPVSPGTSDGCYNNRDWWGKNPNDGPGWCIGQSGATSGWVWGTTLPRLWWQK